LLTKRQHQLAYIHKEHQKYILMMMAQNSVLENTVQFLQELPYFSAANIDMTGLVHFHSMLGGVDFLKLREPLDQKEMLL